MITLMPNTTEHRLSKKKIEKITSNKIALTKFVCCILIVLLHSTRYKMFDVSQAGAIVIDYIALYLPEVAIPMFCTISGFLMFKDIYVDDICIEVISKFANKIKNRFSSLLIPYLVFNVLWMIFAAVTQSIPTIEAHIESAIAFEYNARSILEGIFLFKYNGVAWYLLFLMICSVCAPAFYYGMKKKYVGILTLVFAFVICNIPYPEGWIIGYIAHYNSLFFYCIGAYVALHYFDIVNMNFSKTAIALSSVINAVDIYLIFVVPHGQNEMLLTFLRLVSVYCIWVMMDYFKNKQMRWFMNITFFVYMVHGNIQKCINKIFYLVLPQEGTVYAAINTFGGAILTYVVIGVFGWLIMKRLPNLWCMINGKRNNEKKEKVMSNIIRTIIYYTNLARTKFVRRHIIRYDKHTYSDYFNESRLYAGKKTVCVNEANMEIANRIEQGNPLMVARYGSVELYNMEIFDLNIPEKFDVALQTLTENAGFFPKDIEKARAFASLMEQCSHDVDMLAFWNMFREEYYIKKLMVKDTLLFQLRYLEPWFSENPWTKALKGKKVLVIHPFENTIKSQYTKREQIFSNPDILPCFDLLTLKAVQTSAGETDNRFSDWFEALDWMTNKALNIDFDIALIGCGAYGFSLASRLKRAGKQAIHMGGVLQILFGIKGKRWDDDPVVSKLYNEYWIRPRIEDRPKSASNIEGGCYW